MPRAYSEAVGVKLAGRKSGVKLEVKLRGGVRPSGAEQWSKRVVDSWAAVDSLAARSGAVAATGPTGTPFDVTTEKRRFAFESELLDDVAIEQTELVLSLPGVDAGSVPFPLQWRSICVEGSAGSVDKAVEHLAGLAVPGILFGGFPRFVCELHRLFSECRA